MTLALSRFTTQCSQAPLSSPGSSLISRLLSHFQAPLSSPESSALRLLPHLIVQHYYCKRQYCEAGGGSCLSLCPPPPPILAYISGLYLFTHTHSHNEAGGYSGSSLLVLCITTTTASVPVLRGKRLLRLLILRLLILPRGRPLDFEGY